MEIFKGKMKDLVVVIISYNTAKLTLECLESIYSREWKTDFEVVVLDNNSVDGSGELIEKKFPRALLIKSKKNLGFSKGNNFVVKKMAALNYLFLNSDTVVTDGAIDNLMKFANEKHLDIVSCKLIYPNGNFQPNGGDLPTPITAFLWLLGLDDIMSKFLRVPIYHFSNAGSFKRSLGWVSGSVMLVKSEVIKKVGGFDEGIFMYAEDVELCFRAKKAGFKIGWTDEAKVVHTGGASSLRPHYRQWMGEFKGLLHIYRKNYGSLMELILKLFIYVAIVLRMIIFSLKGKLEFAKTYAQIAINL